MKMILRIIGWLILSLLTTVILAQESEGISMVEYTPGFTFQDGLYLNVEMIKANHPVPLARIATDQNNFNKKFFDQLIAEHRTIFYDDNGVETSVRTTGVWGYALDDRLFIMLGAEFQEIKIQGAISLFIASATTIKPIILKSDGSYTPYNRYPGLQLGSIPSYVTIEGKKYLFDFESNELRGYNSEILEELLNKDSELYTEYTSLPRRQKNRMMLTFIRKYNEKHPLYFPVN